MERRAEDVDAGTLLPMRLPTARAGSMSTRRLDLLNDWNIMLLMCVNLADL
jgi:hypothetical protein